MSQPETRQILAVVYCFSESSQYSEISSSQFGLDPKNADRKTFGFLLTTEIRTCYSGGKGAGPLMIPPPIVEDIEH